jgi:surface polysaccharide O-acyltransferase-like enzyme
MANSSSRPDLKLAAAQKSPLTPSHLNAHPHTRITGIDAIRILAALAVVFLHAKPFMPMHEYGGTVYSALRDIIIQFARFAVPFFFIAAGYFLSRRLTPSPESAKKVWPYIRRISAIYMIWLGVYLLFPPNWMGLLIEGNLKPFYWHLANSVMTFADNPLVFIFKSTGVHLWFLPALIAAVLMLALAIHYRVSGFFLPAAGGLYGLGLLGDAYSSTPIGLSINQHLLLGLCYAPLFVGLGWRLAALVTPKLSTAILLIACGFAMQFAEASWLSHTYGLPLVSSAFLLGTVPFGLGFMLLGLALPHSVGDRLVGSMGSLILGVYLIHIWVKNLLLPLDHIFGGIMWELGFPFLIFGVSLLLATWLSRSRFRSAII